MIKLNSEMMGELATCGKYRAQRWDYTYDGEVVRRYDKHGNVVETRKIDLSAHDAWKNY